jgi:REP-associated tyrosine transposase
MNRRRPRRLHACSYRLPGSYLVTFCTKFRTAVFADRRAAATAVRILKSFHKESRIQLFAYCVMPDHVHAYFRKLGAAEHLSRIVASMKSRIRRELRYSFSWQRGYWDNLTRSHEDPRDIVAYVLSNPVRAGLVDDFRKYEFGGKIEVDGWADIKSAPSGESSDHDRGPT